VVFLNEFTSINNLSSFFILKKRLYSKLINILNNNFSIKDEAIFMENYQICKRCVMDNSSDETITFDDNGYCNYCSSQTKRMPYVYFPNQTGKKMLDQMICTLKKQGINNKYDCLMGISGGLDSSYLAYLGSKWGLRILAVHIDDGFDTDISKSNIERLRKETGFDFVIEKPDTEQFNDLTAAYIRANVPNIAIPQDNILFACLYKYARKYKIKYFLSGGNFALESILQRGNTYTAYDVVNIKAIHKQFGKKPINKLNLLSNYRKAFDLIILKIQSLRPLNYINYNRDKALKELNDFCGFEYYGSKHLENDLTKFIQLYWFHEKFGVDKRRSHLSSMIISNQISRDEAIEELKKPLYDKREMENVITNVLLKLNISNDEFRHIIAQPTKQHTDYKIDKITNIFNKIRLRWK